tara:strand:+ start:749 stop:1690 length:942 start_codon:yes stop_codon:yes gene_type:complete
LKLDFSKSKILVIGDLMLDIFFYGKSNRISPEFPVPVIIEENSKTILGGAANVVNNIASLGGKVEVVGVVGEDSAGKEILNFFNKKNISTNNIFIEKRYKTIVKKRIFSNDIPIARIDEEDSNYEFDFSDEQFKKIEDEIKLSDVIVLSDYNKGFLNRSLLKRIINTASNLSKFVVVDPKKNSFSSYKSADVLTPNLKEIQDATSIEIKNDKHLVEVCRELIKEYSFKSIVVTKSERGISVIGPDNIFDFDGKEVENPDVSGAGDTVISVFSLCISCGLSINESARISNLSASIVVSKKGTSTLEIDELKNIL